MTLHVTLLSGLLALATVSNGCQQAIAEDPLQEPAVIYIRVLEVNSGGYRLVAQSTPAPDVIFNIITPSKEIVAGRTLTCGPLHEGLLNCEEIVLNYMGCFEPEPVAQPPLSHAALRLP